MAAAAAVEVAVAAAVAVAVVVVNGLLLVYANRSTDAYIFVC